MEKMKIKLHDMLLSLSSTVDIITPEFGNHHQQVARLAYRLAEQMELPLQTKHIVFIAGMLHDIGALSHEDRVIPAGKTQMPGNCHAFRGAQLLEGYPLLTPVARAVRYHHVPWENGEGKWFRGERVPMESQLLHMAERVSMRITGPDDVLMQGKTIVEGAQKVGERRYMPELIDALTEIGKKEYVWFELINDGLFNNTDDISINGMRYLGLEEVVDLSKIFARVIDFQNHFTVAHSVTVAAVAEKLGELGGFPEDECKMLRIAGYLHDLGKLAVKGSILLKPGKLTSQEYDAVKSHAYYTYRLLSGISGLETITKWAAFHHENLNGTGYPFHLEASGVPLGARIMAVADVFVALTEDRSYRKGMGKRQVIEVLRSMEKNGELDREIVSCLVVNWDFFKEICRESQKSALEEYRQFFDAGAGM